MAHSARTIHATAAIFWLAAGVLVTAGLLLGGADLGDAAAIPAACSALLGGIGGALLIPVDGHRAPAGVRFAAPEQTRRAVLRPNAAMFVGCVVVFGTLAAFGVWWLLPVITLCLGLTEVVLTAHIARWERGHPRALLAQELAWWRAKRYVWSRAWGDQAPDDVPVAPPWSELAATGFWPSRDPADYR